MKLYVITMPDGSRWGVPAHIIAKDRADHYADGDDNIWNEEYESMMRWFESTDFEFEDWARNNMNWYDVRHFAIRLPDSKMEVDWDEGWVNGDAEYPVEVEDAQS